MNLMHPNHQPMEQLNIQGGVQLNGEITASGSKNAALPIIACCLLTEQTLKITNVPHLNDVTTMLSLVASLGTQVLVTEDMQIHLTTPSLKTHKASPSLVKTMRASFLILGPLLARYGKAQLALPGGCIIGDRPVDQHLKALCHMGAKIALDKNCVNAVAPDGLVGADITFDIKTVTGTENVLMAACLAKGTTRLLNASQEPEVIDLANCLIAMGAKIKGHGTQEITIEGVDSLSQCEHTIIPDRIETGTYLVAAAATRGKITIHNTDASLLTSVLEHLEQAGASLSVNKSSIALEMHGRPKPVNIITDTYPHFPTDMQAQFTALNAIADGQSTITETVFENRFMHIKALQQMGADIRYDKDNTIIIQGCPSLKGSCVEPTDLRASFSLVIAALSSPSTSIIRPICHIDRGYEHIEEKLQALNANVTRSITKNTEKHTPNKNEQTDYCPE